MTRLYEILASVNNSAAARTAQALTKSPVILQTNPRVGEQLFQFEPREVRRLQADQYEILLRDSGEHNIHIAIVAYQRGSVIQV